MDATGYDMNPLAIYIANAKLKSLSTPEPELRKYFFKLGKTYGKRGQSARFVTATNRNERIEYLRRWFDESTLATIEKLRSVILNVTGEYSDIFLVLASDLIRDYSLQEPTDLRIRRRYTPFPKQSLWDAFNFKALRFLDNLASVQQVIGVKKNNSRAFLCDSRTINRLSCLNHSRSYNAAITSPPYATALPYIDTQRLSLVWLDLLSPNDIGNLESYLTGSREFISDQKQQWVNALADNSKHLPSSIYEYCLKLQRAVSKDDGFRRRSVPSLMYRYLSDMRDVFKSMLEVMRNSAPFALIVGHNRTTLGGKQFDIDTPALLKSIALECGWLLGESFTLQTYQRYGSHVANAVRAETLLIVRKP
jgi:site-specific DNA-methyltransferase (cytosine-N4-specific)